MTRGAPGVQVTPVFPALSRRTLLLAAGAVAGCATGRPLGHGISRAGQDPRNSADGQVKMAATLDGSPAFWSYSGVIYAVRPRLRPIPVLGLTGCQAFWAVRQPDGGFHMAAPLLSYFRSIDDGVYLDVYDNPFTGARNEVKPNLFAGHGFAVYPPDGSGMRVGGPIAASESAPKGFNSPRPDAALGRVQWSLTQDSVVLLTDQFFDVVTQPQGEAQTRTADRTQFFDQRVQRLRARYTATTISTWLGWMDMGEADGHLVWHTSGEKLLDAAGLPEDFRQRAGTLLDRLTSRPA